MLSCNGVTCQQLIAVVKHGADDRSAMSALQLVNAAMDTMNGVSLELSNMKRNVDDKDQQIKMLQELNKILQLQASMQPVAAT